MEYTKLKEGAENSLEKLLYVFICPDEKLRNKLYNANEIMEKVCNKIDSLTDEFTLYYDYDEYVQNIGYEEGEKRGKEQQTIEIAKKMLQRNKMALDEIADVTGLSLDEVKKLQNELK